MSRKASSLVAVLLIFVVTSLSGMVTLAQTDDDPIRILRLDSYHPEFPWSAQIELGVLAALEDNDYVVDGESVIFDVFFMDTKRNTSEAYFEQISEETIAYIRETEPDIVIANDDNAASLVAYPLRDEDVRFVLLGVNGTPEGYEFDGSITIAGVLERPHISQITAWIEQVMGEGTRISIIAEDSPTSDRMFGDELIQDTIRESNNELVDVIFTDSYEDWQDYVLSADEITDVLLIGAYATLRDENDETVEPVDVLLWTVSNSPVPVMGFWEEAVHDGTLGGPMISGYNQGYEAAERAIMILEGTPVSEIGFTVPARGKLMINRNAVEQWGVEVPLNILEVSEVIE